MDSREERYKNNGLSRQERNARLYEQVYNNTNSLDNLPLSKNEIYITEMQTEINTRDEYRRARNIDNTSLKENNYEEENVIKKEDKNIYDINKVLDKVKANNEKNKEVNNSTGSRQDYLKKLNIDNIEEVKGMYEDMIAQVDEEAENKLQKTANLSLEILSDLKGDNEQTMVSAPIIEDKLPEIEKTKKMNFYTGDCKFKKGDFEDGEDDMSSEFITESKNNTWKFVLLFLFIIILVIGVLYYLNSIGKIDINFIK